MSFLETISGVIVFGIESVSIKSPALNTLSFGIQLLHATPSLSKQDFFLISLGLSSIDAIPLL